MGGSSAGFFRSCLPDRREGAAAAGELLLPGDQGSAIPNGEEAACSPPLGAAVIPQPPAVPLPNELLIRVGSCALVPIGVPAWGIKVLGCCWVVVVSG